MSDDKRVQFEPLESLTAEPAPEIPAAPEIPEPEIPEPEIPVHASAPPAAPPATERALTPAQIDLDSAMKFEPLEREGRSYVARLARGGLLLVTPPCALASPLADEDGGIHPFVWLRPPPAFRDWLADVETRLLGAALEHKLEWLRKDVPDDSLRASFKSFLRAEDGALRVKAGEGLAAFSADRAPAEPADLCGPRVRCVLALRQLTFGKTEFGGCWRLVQALDVPDAPCLIQDDDFGDDSDADDFV